MAYSDWYTDAGLTNLLASPYIPDVLEDGSVDTQIYFGGTGHTFQANSNPGTDQITITISGGGAQGTASVKLATTQVGLDSATGGAALDLGTSITDSTNFWMRQTDIVSSPGSTQGVYLNINELKVT